MAQQETEEVGIKKCELKFTFRDLLFISSIPYKTAFTVPSIIINRIKPLYNNKISLFFSPALLHLSIGTSIA
jgi:hypothetical protein